jgi:uncharacterized protein with HEPN domain
MGVGNVYRHNYDTVAEEYVWRTVHESLPALSAVVEAEIERLDEVPTCEAARLRGCEAARPRA